MKTTGLVLDSRRYVGAGIPPNVLADMSRFSNNGTFTDITWVQLPSGLWVMAFNATTSEVNCGIGYSLSSYLISAFSLKAWVYANSDGENDEGYIFGKTGYIWFVCLENPSGCFMEATVSYTGVLANARTSVRLTVGAWHQVWMVHNRLGTFRNEIYLDGQLCALSADTAGTVGPTDDRAGNLRIGNNAAGTRTWDGRQIYHSMFRYPVTAAQVLTSFEAERTLFGV